MGMIPIQYYGIIMINANKFKLLHQNNLTHLKIKTILNFIPNVIDQLGMVPFL